ncbi:MAG: TIGR00730 family Rossman fold protein [Acidothermus sp.]|nr:TIGR00730 family Rossman fold protein [Acidothermus sp.]
MATICVFCASSEAIDIRYLELAAAVGTELARRGHRLVSGGGSVSCMGAVARSARAGGAHTIGVIPRALLAMEVADHDADELVVTEDMRSRKAEMERRADGFLVLPGGLGTLEEMLEIWVARSLGLLAKPLVVCDPFGHFAPLRTQVDFLVDAGFVRREVADAVRWTSEVPEAFDVLDTQLRVTPALHPTAGEVLESEP